jgi:putative transposase
VAAFTSLLGAAAEKHACVVSIYCFMPDHVHVLLGGRQESSDAWAAIALFKQRAGVWLGRHRPGIRWQKDFYDHVIRRDEDLGAQVRYIAGNPVRKGLVKDWREYPFTGAIGIDLNAIIGSAITL